MTTITIPKQLIKEGDFVAIPRQKYNEFLKLQKIMSKGITEEADTDLALSVYKKEKKSNKLQTIKSLSDLN